MKNKHKFALCFLILSLFSLSTFAFPDRNLMSEVQDHDGVIIDYEIPHVIDEEEFENAKRNSSGWTSSTRGGILSSIGYFNYGDTVTVRGRNGDYLGKYVVYAESRGETDDEVVYKLLKPLHKSFSAPRIIPEGLIVQKAFRFEITPSYDYIASSIYGSVHQAMLSVSFPKITYPISITLGPMVHYLQGRSLMLIGGSIGAFYDLPLDYMAATTTNLHFTFGFNLNLSSKLNERENAFCYGYSFSAGVRWYALPFMALNVSFAMSSMYDKASSVLFSGYGVRVGVTFET